MFTIIAKSDEVLREYPKVNDWINIMINSFNKKVNFEKIEFYYSYGFFQPSVNKNEQYYIELYEKVSKMYFDERYEFELSKVRVSLTLRLKDFVISDRLEKGFIPESIKIIIKEITKVKMMVECEYNKNEDIKRSIPEIDNSVVSVELIKEIISEEETKIKIEYDIDDILDKISKNGIESLSEEELDFLNKKSNDI